MYTKSFQMSTLRKIKSPLLDLLIDVVGRETFNSLFKIKQRNESRKYSFKMEYFLK